MLLTKKILCLATGTATVFSTGAVVSFLSRGSNPQIVKEEEAQNKPNLRENFEHVDWTGDLLFDCCSGAEDFWF